MKSQVKNVENLAFLKCEDASLKGENYEDRIQGNPLGNYLEIEDQHCLPIHRNRQIGPDSVDTVGW